MSRYRQLHCALLCLGIFCLLTRTVSLAPGAGGNHGELIASSFVLGNCHPTGYPLYQLFGKILMFLPIGAIAFRLNLFSAIALTLTAGLCFTLTQNYRASPLAGSAAAIALACNQNLWRNAAETEVYALTACFWMVLLKMSTQRRQLTRTSLHLIAFALGLITGNHMLLLFMIIPVVTSLILTYKRATLTMLPFAILGASIYLYLPLRAAQEPEINWGNPARFWSMAAHLSGRQFRSNMAELKPGELEYRIVRQTSQLVHALPLPWWTLAILGLLQLVRSRAFRMLKLLAVSSALIMITLFLYTIPDIEDYETPLLVNAFICFAFGFDYLSRLLRALPGRRSGTAITLLFTAGIVVAAVNQGFVFSDCSSRYLGSDYGKALLRNFPYRGVLLFKGDSAGNSLAYLRVIEHFRDDAWLFDENGTLARSPYPELMSNDPRRFLSLRQFVVNAPKPVLVTFRDEIQSQLEIAFHSWGILYLPETPLSREYFRGATLPPLTPLRLRESMAGMSPTEKELLAEHAISLADAFIDRHDESDGMLWYDKAREIAGEFAHINLAIGARYWSLALSQMAVAAAETAAAQDPFNAFAWNNLSWYLLQSGENSDQALAAAGKALELDRENPAFHHTRALVYQKNHELQKAIDDLEFAVRHAPENKTYRADLKALREAAATSGSMP